MIDMDKLTELVPASEAQQTAMNAEKDLQIKAVAHVINTAANTGLYEAKYNTILLPEVKEELEADNEILPDMDDEEIIEHICNSLNSNMTIYTFQQTMLSI